MREQGRGRIVNVSSVAVRVPPGPQWGVYQASKGAFDRWLRSVAPELHAVGVDVNPVYFALVRTRTIEPTPILRKLPGKGAAKGAAELRAAAQRRNGRQRPSGCARRSAITDSVCTLWP